jgi:hypothetical protein
MRGFRPLAHRLIARAIDMHLVADGRDPLHGDVVMLPLRVLRELDGVGAFDVVDDGELTIVRANNERMRLNLDLFVGRRFTSRMPHGARRRHGRASRTPLGSLPQGRPPEDSMARLPALLRQPARHGRNASSSGPGMARPLHDPDDDALLAPLARRRTGVYGGLGFTFQRQPDGNRGRAGE